MTAHDRRPLVVSAELDEPSFAWLDGLRRRHFPPERNRLAAHLTLYHALPGEERARVQADLEELASVIAAIDAWAAGWMSLGRGVAMRIEAPRLLALRAELARRWQPLLTRQDAAPVRLHVTVQNKVAPAQARALRERLEREHGPRSVRVPALRLWRYDGGPWEPLARLPLQGALTPADERR